ncbi:hypothetical protein TSOC_010135 [Tetrabaena socialis]|uniref:Nucleotide-diphospho-sugar transferase domain-containing protein n=1 Tax=Tetrabaena socialis TaxID=47790 RepID=A0A2J7ZU31_9CHLO|nr:hypothetical protein TSOC_010135 [Tetrabaena socialis]|eukprot:PNH03781.1 hypothetical protein TSOC_010135 [Tetrabaena socialis]
MWPRPRAVPRRCRAMAAAVAAGLYAVLLLVHKAEAGRVCERSGYCSVGQVAGYVGPVDTAVELRQAVEATAYRKELIIIPETRVLSAAQVLMHFRDAGYGHVLMVMDHCDRLVSVMRPRASRDGPISCGTYSSKELGGPTGFPYFKRIIGSFEAWWWKWMTAGRAVALGYNVLAIDSDTVVLSDWYVPYWRVKQPPLSTVQMACQNENAASNGPVVWILYELIHRVGTHPVLGIDDQGILQEALFSSILGRPVFPSLIAIFRSDEEAFKGMGLINGSRVVNASSELAPAVCETFAVNCSTPLATLHWTSAELHVPHSGGQWPAKLGGYPFSRTIGPYTAAYRKAFTDLGVPLPPDIEDPATEAVARAIPSERFTYLAKEVGLADTQLAWAEGTWWNVGRHGWWHTHLAGGRSDSTAMGHIWAGLFPGSFQKTLILQFTGHFDWATAARVARDPHRIYHTNQELPPGVLPQNAPGVHSVVAFSPGVIHAAMTKEQFVQAAQGLAQVAVVLGAAAAWPAVPCDSEWALSAEGRSRVQRPIKHSIPWWYLDTFFQVQPFGDSLAELQCEWVGFSFRGCLANRFPPGQEVGRGLLAVEFHHLRNTTGARPAPDTTLLLSDTVLPPPPAGSTMPHRVAAADLLRLNAGSVLRRIQREPMAVLWVDRLVEVVELAGEAAATYGRWLDKCEALKYYSLPLQQRERW